MIRTGGMFGFISGEFRKNLASLSRRNPPSISTEGKALFNPLLLRRSSRLASNNSRQYFRSRSKPTKLVNRIFFDFHYIFADQHSPERRPIRKAPTPGTGHP